jgi:hypothetical protein
MNAQMPLVMPDSWEALSTQEQVALLRMSDTDLADRFGEEPSFFKAIRTFFEKVPKTTKKPQPVPHYPPKDLIISARRDLSFYEANFELFDNSIDRWRLAGAKKELTIRVEYDLDLRKGEYYDDAGGMEEGSVFKVFIPGETTNTDLGKPVIGSFGMGAKKAIFRLSDGAKVVSCTSSKFSSTSEVPEGWETTPNWETLDGRAEAMKVGTTQIYLFKLFDPPTISEINELIKRAGRVYRPLLDGTLVKRKVNVFVNRTLVVPARQPNWSAPKGAEPRIYDFAHVFENFLDTGEDIELRFRFKCGLTQKLPGGGSGTDPDWGVDVYGNGRLIDTFLKDEFGFGTQNMSKNAQGSKHFRGELFIDGHSFAIPWDTHKREYLKDHTVSRWLRERVRPLVKAYVTIGGRFASETALRSTVLARSKPSGSVKIFKLEEDEAAPPSALPTWSYGARTGGKTGTKKKSKSTRSNDENEVDSQESDLVIPFERAELDSLMQRFGSDDEAGLAGDLFDCLLTGVAFPLEPDEFAAALKLLKCTDAAELSGEVKAQLVKKLRR